MPNPERLLSTLSQAARAFRATPGRVGRVVRLPAGVEILVAGDLHGNVENFRLLLQTAELAKNPGLHLVLQEVVHGPFRYAGGGEKSHQLLDLMAALKCQYPTRIHFLLGNHELAQWQNQRIGKGDVDQNQVFMAGVEEAYGNLAQAIYAAYLELFAAADLAVVSANRILLCHSLPNAKHLATFDWAVLEKDTLRPEDLVLGGTVHSLVWGRDLRQEHVEEFLKKVDADLLISGHIPCEQGYMVPNDRQIIVDSLGTPACYCRFPTDKPLSQQDLLGLVGVL
jgi:Calcineurin-like phosphoesterase